MSRLSVSWFDIHVSIHQRCVCVCVCVCVPLSLSWYFICMYFVYFLYYTLIRVFCVCVYTLDFHGCALIRIEFIYTLSSLIDALHAGIAGITSIQV